MKGQLEGKRIVVTGAGRGLGRAVAVAFAKEGASLTLCARTESELAKTTEMIRAGGGRVDPHQVDLGDPRACEEFIAVVLEEDPRVDVLVNNAGVLRLTPMNELTFEEWSWNLAVNLTAPFLLMRGFFSAFTGGGGSIINVSSRAGVMGFKDEAAYCTTKFGLEGLTRALAVELSDFEVSVNTVTPGLKIKPTSISEKDFEALSERERSGWNDPEALCPAFVFLAGLRGEVSGLRFDAHRLSQKLRQAGYDLKPAELRELAE